MRDVQKSIRLPKRLVRLIESRLDDNTTFTDFVVEAISERVRHAEDGNKSRFRELQIFPARESENGESGNPLERRMEQLLGRNGHATASFSGSSELDPEFDAALKDALTDKQYRRLTLHLTEGLTMEQMAHREGCAKQAIHTSLHAAIAKIRKNKGLEAALMAKVAEQSAEVGGTYSYEGGGIGFDRMLELVAGGTALRGDFSAAEIGKFHTVLARAMKPILTRKQFRRLEAYMVAGMTMEQIAYEEDCSVNSVSRAIRLAKNKLRGSVPVCRAVVQCYNDTTGAEVDAEPMLAALRARRLDTQELS